MKYSTPVMDNWYRERPGSLLLQMEASLLDPLLEAIPGWHIVQMGGPSDLSLLDASVIPNKTFLSEVRRNQSEVKQVVTDYCELPLQLNSVDAVVVSHLLEFIDEPQRLLHDVYHALMPDGQLLLFGFNPWSLWGFNKAAKQKSFPWSGHFHSLSKVKQWLRTIGFHITSTKTICFRPPTSDRNKWEKLLFLEPFGQVCAPRCGGVYFIEAQKRVLGATPIVSKNYRRKKVPVRGSLVNPAARQMK